MEWGEKRKEKEKNGKPNITRGSRFTGVVNNFFGLQEQEASCNMIFYLLLGTMHLKNKN